MDHKTVEEFRALLDGYDYGDGTISLTGDETIDDCIGIAAEIGATLYRPGEYHNHPHCVLTDGCYAYSVNDKGSIDTIAG